MDDRIETVEKLKSGNYTDEDRAKLMPQDLSAMVGGVDLVGLEAELGKDGSDEQRRCFSEKSSNFYDGIRPYLLAKGREMPLFEDVFKRNSKAAVMHVNARANDFNSANEEMCPSIMLAHWFDERMAALNVAQTAENRKFYQTEINDLLYVYKKLRDYKKEIIIYAPGNPTPQVKVAEQGLNQEIIDAYKKTHPKEDIPAIFDQMDALLEHPEQERFPKGPPKKLGFWGRLFFGKGRVAS